MTQLLHVAIVPVFGQLSAWGVRYLSVPEEFAAKARLLAAGGPAMWETFMDELRETHLGPRARRQPAPDGAAIAAQLEAAYSAALQRPVSEATSR